MNEPLVSVIVPAFNHGNYIKQLLDSLINQTYQKIELIILNDGSTDNTHDQIVDYENKLKNRFASYKYINKENEGICKTLNKGILLSKGQLIKPIASDDYLFPETIKMQVEFFEENEDHGLVYTDGYHVESSSLSKFENLFDESKRFSNQMEFQSGDLFEFMMSNVFLMPTPSIMIRKECYDKVGLYDEDLLCEDPDMFIRISKHYKIGCINKPLVLHRIHDNNSGRNPNIIVPTVERMIEKYSEENFENQEHKATLLQLLYRVSGTLNYDRISNRLVGKKIVGWGTGSSYRRTQTKYKIPVQYLVDSSSERQGTTIDNLMVYSPSELLKEERGEIYILVFSQYFKEIYEWLDRHGFEYEKDYY